MQLTVNIKNILTLCFLPLFLLPATNGDWPSGLRHCSRIERILVQTPIGAWFVLGTQPYHQAPGDLRIELYQKGTDKHRVRQAAP